MESEDNCNMVGGFIRKILETKAEDLGIRYEDIPKGDSLIRKRGRIDWGRGFLKGSSGRNLTYPESTDPLRNT